MYLRKSMISDPFLSTKDHYTIDGEEIGTCKMRREPKSGRFSENLTENVLLTNNYHLPVVVINLDCHPPPPPPLLLNMYLTVHAWWFNAYTLVWIPHKRKYTTPQSQLQVLRQFHLMIRTITLSDKIYFLMHLRCQSSSCKIQLQTKVNIYICYHTVFMKITILSHVYVHFYCFKNVNVNINCYYQRLSIDIFHCKAFCD